MITSEFNALFAIVVHLLPVTEPVTPFECCRQKNKTKTHKKSGINLVFLKSEAVMHSCMHKLLV